MDMGQIAEFLIQPALGLGLVLGALSMLLARGMRRDADGEEETETLRAEVARAARQARAPRLVAEYAPDGLVIQDMKGRIEWVNPAFTELTGWPAHEVIGLHPQAFLLPAEMRPGAAELELFRFDPSSEIFEGYQIVEHVTRDGERFWNQLGFALAAEPEDDAPTRVVVTCRDVTEQIEQIDAAQEVLGQHAVQEAALRACHDAVLLQDMTGRVIWASEGIRRITGHGPGHLRGRHLDRLLAGQTGEGAPFDPGSEAFRSNRVAQATRRDGTRIWVELRHALYRPPPNESDPAPREHVLTTCRDVTRLVQREQALTEAREEIRVREERDPVTGLPNRACFVERLGQILAESGDSNRRTGLIHVELETFREVNEALGRTAGDAVLREVAERLQALMQDGDLIGRAGGNEFALACPGIRGLGMLERTARDAASGLRAPILWQGCQVRLGLRIGLSFSEPGQFQASRLLRQTAIALDHARETGSTGIQRYTDALGTAHFRRQSLLSDLSATAVETQFEIAFQPQLDLREGRVTGVEALLRWCHPEHGVLGPADFLALSRHAGIFTDLDLFAMKTALEGLAALDEAAGTTLSVGLNVTAATLAQPRYAERLKWTAEQFGIDAERIQIEVPQEALSGDAVRCVRSLRETGFRPVLDDFGAGRLPSLTEACREIVGVKLSGALLKGLPGADPALAVLRAILGLCSELGLKATATAVETPDQAALLNDLGATTLQGYALAAPLTREGVLDWLGRQRAERPARHGR